MCNLTSGSYLDRQDMVRKAGEKREYRNSQERPPVLLEAPYLNKLRDPLDKCSVVIRSTKIDAGFDIGEYNPAPVFQSHS